MHLRYAFVTLAFLVPGVTRAGVIIEAPDMPPVTVQAGDTAFVEFFIRSSSPVTLFSASYKFEISGANPGADLRFAAKDDQLTDFTLETSYLFPGGSAFFNEVESPFTTLGGDGFEALPIPPLGSGELDSSTSKLLVRLQVEAALQAAPGTYEISLIRNESLFFGDDPNSLNGEVEIDPEGRSARVTIVEAAIPEPASVLIWTFLGGVGILGARRRKRK